LCLTARLPILTPGEKPGRSSDDHRLGALLTLLWPVLHTLIFLVRFGNLPPDGLTEAVVFLPMGLVAGVALVLLVRRATSRRGQIGAIAGYLIAAPFALVGSLLGGLMLPPVVGTLIFGALPLIAGAVVGYAIGNRRLATA
jgi:hypothetical protein